MYIIYCEEINLYISKFLLNIDIVNWRSCCKFNYYQKYSLTEYIYKYLPKLYLSYNIKYLYAHKKYKDIDLYNIPNLKYLLCGNNNNITDKGISHLTNLIKLQCHTNDKITDLSIFKLKKLKYLSLDSNHNIKYSVNNLSNLTYLNCNSYIYENNINKLSNLKSLIIEDNINITDNLFNNFNKLQTLICNITILTDNCFQYISNLKYLECGISSFSISHISNLIFLHTLKLSIYTKIDNIESFKKLKNLTYLDCGNISILTDEVLLSLPNLCHLTLISNLFTDNGISTLTNLISLHCSYNNNISNNSLYYLYNLKCLNLGYNKKINDLGLQTLTNLTYLHCGTNDNITDLSINKLHNLTYLHTGNNINISNKTISNLHKLKFLNIGYN
jgi:hypothetical protein